MAGIYNASAKATDAKPGKVNNSALPDITPFIQAGINPKTGLPYRHGGTEGPGLKDNIKKTLRVADEQAAINSIKWYNLPNGLNGNLIERILYYKGQGMFFYMPDIDQFYFLPYALDGTIDVYGRFVDVTPLPFNGTANDGDDKPWITGLRRHCKYDIQLDAMDVDDLINSCVLLHDYSQQVSQTNISRQILNDPIIDLESDMLPFARTSLLNSTGVTGMRVSTEDEQSNVKAASASINRAALNGEKYIPIVGQVDFQDMTGDKIGNADAFLMTMQSIDNYRMQTHGVDSGGIFQKQAHMLESENQMNAGKASFAMQDRLSQRQDFCDIVNSIWGLGIWCEVAQPAIGVDQDMDGEMYDNDPDTISYESSNTNNGGVEDGSY